MSEDRVFPFGNPSEAPVADEVVSKKPAKKADDVKEGDVDGSAQV